MRLPMYRTLLKAKDHRFQILAFCEQAPDFLEAESYHGFVGSRQEARGKRLPGHCRRHNKNFGPKCIRWGPTVTPILATAAFCGMVLLVALLSGN